MQRSPVRLTGMLVGLAGALALGLVIAPAPASAATQPCRSVGVFGLRGSGQSSGFGDQVKAVVDGLTNELGVADRDVAEFPVEYTAASTNMLRPPLVVPSLLTAGDLADYKNSVDEFLASVDNGADTLYTSLDLRVKRCPAETLVLVGYSQGSMAIRVALKKMAARGETAILDRIGGVGLVADPTKRPNEPNVGSADALSSGVATTIHSHGAPIEIPDEVAGYASNACQDHDLVCDFSVHSNTGVHGSYTSTQSLGALVSWLEPRVVRKSSPNAASGGSEKQATPTGRTFTVMNTDEVAPDGVWFRDSPRTADTDKVTGHGVYRDDRVEVQCYAKGEAVGGYGTTAWYKVKNTTRPEVPGSGAPNVGYLNAHYIGDGLTAAQVEDGVPEC